MGLEIPISLFVRILVGRNRSILKISMYHLLAIATCRRYKKKQIKLGKITITIIDSTSFLFSYYDIFIKEIYKFKSESQSPKILDCGSNIGLSILYFQAIFPMSKIIGFEPDPLIYKILSQNVGSNKNVCVYNRAVWNKKTTIPFLPDNADGGKIIEFKMDSSIYVKTINLSQFLIGQIDFLKIDAEGAEWIILSEIAGKLKFVKNLFLEYHSKVDYEQDLSSILKILLQNGFRFHIQETGVKSRQPFLHLNELNGFDNQLNIFANS